MDKDVKHFYIYTEDIPNLADHVTAPDSYRHDDWDNMQEQLVGAYLEENNLFEKKPMIFIGA